MGKVRENKLKLNPYKTIELLMGILVNWVTALDRTAFPLKEPVDAWGIQARWSWSNPGSLEFTSLGGLYYGW